MSWTLQHLTWPQILARIDLPKVVKLGQQLIKLGLQRLLFSSIFPLLHILVPQNMAQFIEIFHHFKTHEQLLDPNSDRTLDRMMDQIYPIFHVFDGILDHFVISFDHFSVFFPQIAL